MFPPDLFNHMVTRNSSILDDSYPRSLESLFSCYGPGLGGFGDLLYYTYSVDATIFKVIDEIMERADIVCGISTFAIQSYQSFI